jgi:UDP-GlcNAc:undecaprenyl-phosphate GlcNAc-1-phosphate transferase
VVVLTLTFFLVAAFAAALCLTPLLRAVALRTERFGRPGDDGSVPIPPTGGLAIFLATFLLLPFSSLSFPTGLWIGTCGMATIGFIDDVHPFSPVQKLGLQIAAVGAAVGFGLRFVVVDHPVVDALLTGVWLIWMCNAFNVLDMVDGLAAGVGAIAAMGLAGLGLVVHAPPVVILAAAMVGGFGGFLVYNSHPARIYMGDTGSLFAGFALGGMAVEVSQGLPGAQGILCPLIVLGIPSFEAAFLCVVRRGKGLPIMRASRDHVAQRLVQMGYSVRGAVGRMYAMGGLLVFLGITGAVGPAVACWAVFGCTAALAMWAGVRLARVGMERDGEGA